ncbi:hypothetical protein EW146_g3384 [Bondarzewia mesenterica]|uniref:CCHC-type domain-containing protein n=1 Tax=Bondarzewia mesenterica TaxID=1095465 RepID=A0A4S4LZ53_9AGAM|nr:hypothetical protein EW146_g3384 [Bondarzewia mesenterica]
MAYQFSRKGCFKCGNRAFIHFPFPYAFAFVTETDWVSPTPKKSAILPRTARRSSVYATTVCYSCGGVGHIQAECPSLRVQGGNQKCYNCGRFGHIARVCPNGAGGGLGFASRAPPPGRGLNTSSLPPVKCYRCGGPNHMARDCLAAPGITADGINGHGAANLNKGKTCYKCQQEGHIARDCPETADYTA